MNCVVGAKHALRNVLNNCFSQVALKAITEIGVCMFANVSPRIMCVTLLRAANIEDHIKVNNLPKYVVEKLMMQIIMVSHIAFYFLYLEFSNNEIDGQDDFVCFRQPFTATGPSIGAETGE